MQVFSVTSEPISTIFKVWTSLRYMCPEPGGMIHFAQMSHLVRDQIVERKRRSHNDAQWKGQKIDNGSCFTPAGLGFVPDSEAVRDADIKGSPVLGVDSKVREEFQRVKKSIVEQMGKGEE